MSVIGSPVRRFTRRPLPAVELSSCRARPILFIVFLSRTVPRLRKTSASSSPTPRDPQSTAACARHTAAPGLGPPARPGRAGVVKPARPLVEEVVVGEPPEVPPRRPLRRANAGTSTRGSRGPGRCPSPPALGSAGAAQATRSGPGSPRAWPRTRPRVLPRPAALAAVPPGREVTTPRSPGTAPRDAARPPPGRPPRRRQSEPPAVARTPTSKNTRVPVRPGVTRRPPPAGRLRPWPSDVRSARTQLLSTGWTRSPPLRVGRAEGRNRWGESTRRRSGPWAWPLVQVAFERDRFDAVIPTPLSGASTAWPTTGPPASVS